MCIRHRKSFTFTWPDIIFFGTCGINHLQTFLNYSVLTLKQSISQINHETETVCHLFRVLTHKPIVYNNVSHLRLSLIS